MDWGDPEFVLSIIAMVIFAGVIKAAIHARYGLPTRERPHGPGGKRTRSEIEILRGESARLTERVEAYEDRIAVLERIVTDSGYRLRHEIESLRDELPRLDEGRKTQ